MEKVPGFIRSFAREQSANTEPNEEGLSPRQQVAQEILAKRAEYFDRQKVLDSTMAEINELTERLQDISETVPKKIMHYLEYRKLRAELEELTAEHGKLIEGQPNIGDGELPPELQEARQMLRDYYSGIKREWTEADFDEADMERYFTVEYLSSLSMEEYELLLSRFPGKMMTHVTKHGIKDHTVGGVYAMYMGISDVEGHFKSGTVDMFREGAMRSVIGLAIADSKKMDTLANAIFKGCSTREEALERLNRGLANQIQPGEHGISYSDKTALHFAAGEVLDKVYGGEAGNEIFIAYPTYLIANEFYANNFQEGGGIHNDVWVWQRENEGIPLDAGVVFIPKSVMVSPKSGSKYEVDLGGRPELDEANISALESLIGTDVAKEIVDSPEENPELKKRLIDEFGLSEELSDVLFTRERSLIGAFTKETYMRDSFFSVDGIDLMSDEEYRKGALEYIKTLLANHQLLFKRAENPILSEQYWEQYFTEHPEQRPAHIVYYDGDPTSALSNWQRTSGITKNDYAKKIDLASRVVHKGAPERLSGAEEFRRLMIDIINERFT